MKKTFEDLWDKQGQVLDKASRSRFRSSSTVTIQLVALWEIFSGDFSPVAKKQLGISFLVSPKSIDRITEELLSPKHNVICINDGDGTEDSEFDSLKQIVQDAFSKKLPEKSSFES